MVYVDTARWKLGRMLMCHMMADTVAELHAMADRLGLKREWFQPAPPHYDICKAFRARALKYGAIAADRRRVVELIRAWRAGKSPLKGESK